MFFILSSRDTAFYNTMAIIVLSVLKLMFFSAENTFKFTIALLLTAGQLSAGHCPVQLILSLTIL